MTDSSPHAHQSRKIAGATVLLADHDRRSDMEVELVLDARAEIGESPVWDGEARELVWVDILRGLLNRFDPETGSNRSIGIGQPLGAVALGRDGDLVLAVRDGFALMDGRGELQMLARVEAEEPLSRMNDGACDSSGRFWAGTTHADRAPGSGALYRLEPPDAVTRVLGEVTLSNGIDWSLDGRTMYFIDSASQCVDAFDFEPEAGLVDNRRHLVEIPPALGMPDGLTVDADGFVWVALYRGGAIRRYSPEGVFDLQVDLPVSLVTSCVFGGDDLRTLYVTTASRGLDRDGLRREPVAGGIFRLRPGVTGRSANTFGQTPRL